MFAWHVIRHADGILMWPSVEQEFVQLLCKTPFPDLQGNADYDRMRTGNGLPDPKSCAKAVSELFLKGKLRDGVHEFGRKELPKAQVWQKPLLRAVSPKNNPGGAWWFEEDLVLRWSTKFPPGTPDRKRNIMESIRPMLAVCEDWNGFTDLRVIRPSSIPVVTGQGRHQLIHPKQDPLDPSKINPLYAANANVFFIGGFRQIFVPFVRPRSSAAYPL